MRAQVVILPLRKVALLAALPQDGTGAVPGCRAAAARHVFGGRVDFDVAHAGALVRRYSVTREMPSSQPRRPGARDGATAPVRSPCRSAASRACASEIAATSTYSPSSRSRAVICRPSDITIARRTRLISSRTFPGQP